ncbi:hypothetical protein LFT48_00440 [Arthrobacter sp. FW305-123]|nr:hypothetical protein LFT48_00440 [Arthrobacter sp. FW305-123]
MDSLMFLSALSGSLAACVAVTFLLAAWGKLMSPGSVAAGMESMGVPSFLRHRLIARGLPWIEIAIAVGLLTAPGIWFLLFAAAALLLSAAFLAIVWLAAIEKEPAQCNCFGTKKTTISRWTVIRNAVLTIAAGAALAGSGPGFLWRADLPAVVVGFLAVALAVLGGVAVAPEVTGVDGGLPAVKRSSELGLRDVRLQTVNLQSIARESPVVLLFTRKGCPSCMIAGDALRAWQARTAGLATARLVLDESPQSALELHPDLADHLLLDSGKMAARLMNISKFPSAFLIGRDGEFATPAIEGPKDIAEFLDVLGDTLVAAQV